jgi:hypothetical protein
MKTQILILTLGLFLFACKSNSTSNDQSSNDCGCFGGIGSSESDAPSLKTTFSNGTSLSICGYFDEKDQQEEGLTMSEFNVFDCKTGASLVEYGAVQTCIIKEEKDAIIIKELKRLPVGKDWNWEFIQIAQQEITASEDGATVSESVPALGAFTIDEATQEAFLNSLQKGAGIRLSESEKELGRLEVLSLLGNEKAWEILKNYAEFIGGTPDGYIAEQWHDAIATVEWIRGE